MRRFIFFVKDVIASGAVGMALVSGGAQAADELPPIASGGNGTSQVAQKEPDQKPKSEEPPPQPPRAEPSPLPELPPPQPPGTTAPAPEAAGAAERLPISLGNTGGAGAPPGASPQQAQFTTGGGPTNALTGAEALPRASTDVGDLLSKSQSVQGVEVQRRNPIVTDPRVRGYHFGQLDTFLDGAFLLPARYDLDTAVSKIDSSLIRDTVVLKGPYSVRYGPGFAFLSVETLGSWRSPDGCFEAHGSTSLLYKTNGDQWRGRQSFWGGDTDWGFRIGYDLMAGDDYEDGHGRRIPSGYHSQNVDAAFGFDLDEHNHFEFKVVRQDQHDVQLPGQAFDLNYSTTDAYSARYVLDGQEYFNRFTVEGWYNYTRFNGDNFRPAKREQIFFPDPTNPGRTFTGITDGDVEIPGYRTYVTWGQDKSAQLSVGSDFRYISQHLNEFDTIVGQTTSNPIPRSHLVDPGVFIDGLLPLFDNRLLLKAGFRADWVSTDIDDLPVGLTIPLTDPQVFGRPGPYGRDFDLWSAYATAEYKMTDHWTAQGGFGNALRPPTPTELYAVRPLMAVVQNGFSFTTGNPDLNAEELRQLDLGVRAEYDTFRFGLSGFYSWIHNYITFEEFLRSPLPPDVHSLRFVNTNRATLSGFESYAEWDMLEWLSPFYTMSYVEGRDLTRDNRGITASGPQEPLPGIPPFESTLGVRLHDARKAVWGVELGVRLVASQNRVAESLGEVATPGFTVVNLRSYWQVNKALLLTAGVENLTNTFYREHLDLRTGQGVFEPGVNFYFGTQLTY